MRHPSIPPTLDNADERAYIAWGISAIDRFHIRDQPDGETSLLFDLICEKD